MDCSDNAARCPETMKALGKIPGLSTAFFSILSPGKHIPPHRGAYNGVLRLHLALQVPEPRDLVRIRIARQICHWEEGKCLIFDDTFNHEVWNDTAGYRVVLFVALKAEREGRAVFNQTWAMDAWGDARGSAMGRLVSVPVSLAIESVLAREFPAGVHAAPHDPKLIEKFLGQVTHLAQYMQRIDQA